MNGRGLYQAGFGRIARGPPRFGPKHSGATEFGSEGTKRILSYELSFRATGRWSMRHERTTPRSDFSQSQRLLMTKMRELIPELL